MIAGFQFIGEIQSIFPTTLKRLHGWQPRRRLYVFLSLAPVLWVRLKLLERRRKRVVNCSFPQEQAQLCRTFWMQSGKGNEGNSKQCEYRLGYSWEDQASCLPTVWCWLKADLWRKQKREPFLRMQRRLQCLFQPTKSLPGSNLGRTWRKDTHPTRNIGWDWFFHASLIQ